MTQGYVSLSNCFNAYKVVFATASVQPIRLWSISFLCHFLVNDPLYLCVSSVCDVIAIAN